jgi:hypothetical protein
MNMKCDRCEKENTVLLTDEELYDNGGLIYEWWECLDCPCVFPVLIDDTAFQMTATAADMEDASE